MSIQKSEIVSDLGKGETQDLWICVFRFFRCPSGK